VQTNNNESSWEKKKQQQLSNANKQKIYKVAKTIENFNFKKSR
jgi:hypothetical protein